MTTPFDILTGTITLTNGSAAFTGTGTSWIADDIREGDTIVYLAGGMGWMPPIIATITSDTAGTLIAPWEGPTLTGVAYRIRYYWDSGRVAAQSRNLVQTLGNGNIQALAGLTGPGVATFDGPHSMEIKPFTDFISGVAVNVRVQTLAERAAYDGQSAGFSVYVQNIGDGRAATYFKNTNTSADWSAPGYVTGPASTVPGPAGVTPRGPYNGVAVYAVNDIATFNGSSFRKLTTAGAGNAPSSAIPPVDNANWEVFAAKGTNGAGTVSSVAPGAFIAVNNTDPTAPVVSVDIAALTGASTLDGTEVLPVLQGSNPRKATALNIALLAMLHGQCQLALSSGSLRLNRFNGRYIIINSKVEEVPSTPPALAATGLTPATLYFIYAYMNSGVMTLEASTTGHSINSATGVEIKTGDATRTLVGMAYCVTGPAWADTDAQRLVASWFNRSLTVAFKKHGASRSTTSNTFVELGTADRVEFVSWASRLVAHYTGSVSTDTANRGAICGVGFDGTAPAQFYATAYMESTGQDHNISSTLPISGLSEGYHYASPYGARAGDGTRSWASIGGTSVNLHI